MPKPTQELMLTNLHETIAEQLQKEHQGLKERREDLDDHHHEVHNELQRQLSRRNSCRATKLELTSNNRTMPLNHQANIQETSQTTDMLFDYSQTTCVHALRMLDSSPPNLENSQELTVGLEPESVQSPDLASPLSLSLDESQDCLPPVSDNTL